MPRTKTNHTATIAMMASAATTMIVIVLRDMPRLGATVASGAP